MCGILFARIKDNNDTDFAAIFKSALDKMRYRGPDNVGYLQVKNNYFGHVRLAIIDPTAQSNQPIYDDEYVMLFSGEIYNYKELDEKASSDTLALFSSLKNNAELPLSIAGMYAVLFYLIKEDKVILRRDFYGEKPLYYYNDANIFIASSTIQSIVYILQKKYAIEPHIEKQAVYEYLLFGYIREPKTIYQNIHVLQSGHIMTVLSNNHIQIENKVSAMLDHSRISPEDYAVKCFTSSDVEPSLLLSSGVDSAYILSLVQGKQSNYSVVIYQSPNIDEDESVRAMINLSKICDPSLPKFQIVGNHSDMVHIYENFTKILEQPTSDGVNLYNILYNYRAISEDNRLVLTGLGGDELYGGYNSFKYYKHYKLLLKNKYNKKFLPHKYKRFFLLSEKLRKDYPVETYYFQYRICPLISPHVDLAVINNLFEKFNDHINAFTVQAKPSSSFQLKVCETMDYMRNQLIRDSDNIALALGFEARSPMLNTQAFNIEPDHKQAMKATLLSSNNIKFGKKKGFKLHDDKQKLADFFLTSICARNEYYQLISDNFLTRIRNDKQKYFEVLKKLYILLEWFQVNLITDKKLNGFTIV